MSAPSASRLEAAVLILAAGQERICLRVERAYADHLRHVDPQQFADATLRAQCRVLLDDLKRMYPGTGPSPELDEDKAAALARRILDLYDAVLKDAGQAWPP